MCGYFAFIGLAMIIGLLVLSIKWLLIIIAILAIIALICHLAA